MNTNFTIKNFRIFDSEGVEIDLKPLTLLTGCNSSGKSSIVKALLLMCNYFSDLKEDKRNEKKINLISHKLDFSKTPHNKLGKFSKVINDKSETNSITMIVRVHSLMLAQDIDVEIEFSQLPFDQGTHGYISSIILKKIDGTIIYYSTPNCKYAGNFYSLFPEFLNFTILQYYISTYQSQTLEYEIFGVHTTKEEREHVVNELKKLTDIYKKDNRSKDILLDINKWNNKNRSKGSIGIFISKLLSINSLEKVRDNNILYYMPVLESKLSGSKQECIETLLEFKEKQKYKIYKLAIDKIVAEFQNSNHDSFLSFYRFYEQEYLSNFESNASDLFHESAAPCLISATYLLRLKACELQILQNPKGIPVLRPHSDEVNKVKSFEDELKDFEKKPLDFKTLFEILAEMSDGDEKGQDYFYVEEYFHSKVENLFFKFIKQAFEEIVVDATPDDLLYVSSSIINIKRLYPLESTDELTSLLKTYIDITASYDGSDAYKPNTFMNKWVKKFGIGDHISINTDSEGLGMTIRLHRDKKDKKGTLLADQGYGITQLFAILLHIEAAIMGRRIQRVLPENDINPMPLNSDYIISYLPPTLAIEEPEIHLHPRFQSLLAEMFVDAYKNFRIHFIIETHSEYLMRKMQVLVAEKNISSGDIAVIYANEPGNKTENAKISSIKQIEIESDGSLSDNFGSGFYDEATNNFQRLMNI